MKEENPYNIDVEYIATSSDLKLSTGFKTMMMNAMDLKWVELPDCVPNDQQGHGDQIQLVFNAGGQPENGTVATCKPRIKNNEGQPLWEEKARAARVFNKANATANASSNSTANGTNASGNASGGANATNVTKLATDANVAKSSTTKA